MMEKKFEEKAERLFKAFSSEISRMPDAYSQMLIALDFGLGPSKEIVIAGDINTQVCQNKMLFWF